MTEELSELDQLTIDANELETKIKAAEKRLTATMRIQNRETAAYNDLRIRGAEYAEVEESWRRCEKANADVSAANNEYEMLDGQRGYLKIAFGEAQIRAQQRSRKEAYPANGGILTDAGLRNVFQHVWRDPKGAFVGSASFNATVGSDDPRALEALRLHFQMIACSAEAMIGTLQRIPSGPPAGAKSFVLPGSQPLGMREIAAAMANPHNGR